MCSLLLQLLSSGAEGQGPVPRESATVEIQRNERRKVQDIDLVSISSGRVQTNEGKNGRLPFSYSVIAK